MNKMNESTASSVMAELCGDKTIVQKVETNLVKTRFVTFMSEARVRKGMTQKDVADKMGTSVSKISRLEALNDDDLRLGDIKDYLSAIGLDVSIAILDKSLPTANRIKHYVFEIERLLNHLTSLAKGCEGDKSIVDGIARFRGEVLYKFLVKYMSSGKDFPIMFTSDADTEVQTNKGETILQMKSLPSHRCAVGSQKP